MIDEIQNPDALHIFMMPGGYVAPRGLFKLFYEGAVCSNSRRQSLAFMMKVLRDTRVVCGRCGATIDCRLWGESEIRRFHALARHQGRREP